MQQYEHGVLTQKLQDLLSQPEGEAELAALLGEVRGEDIAEALADFAVDDKIRVLEATPPDQRVVALAETDPTSLKELTELLPSATLAQLVGEMDPDDAVDVLEETPAEKQSQIINALPPEFAADVRSLRLHEPESAGGIMTPALVSVDESQSAKEVLELLQQTIDTEVVAYVYVVDDDNHLRGVVSLRKLIAASPTDYVRDIMRDDVIKAHLEDDQEQVANLARKYNLNSIPVVDSNDRLQGVATIDDIVDIISDEADEDIYRLAGSPASHPAQQPIIRRAMIRTPWLLLSLTAGFVMAFLEKNQMEKESATLPEGLLLTAFIPLVIGLSGGVGTQSATLIARGLATGEVDTSRTWRIFLQELCIGSAIGLFMGLMVLIMLSTMFEEMSMRFPIAVSLGITSGILLATICGTLIPLMCRWLNIDPALVAGPFVTSMNDIIGSLAFLGIGNVVLGA